ncbi:sugar kinase [Alphaproteobacteria bacterium]|nr:sugar kinase [Alphaproteobacteria bacterium]
MKIPRIVLMGEAMLELSHPKGEGPKLAYGGDVLNTSIYLARLGLLPHIVTALGCDPYSDGLVKDWESEGLQTVHVLRDPDRLPGLYGIQTDNKGERSFYYWRSQSAARNFFNLEDCSKSIALMEDADWLFISGITLSIFTSEEQKKLGAIAEIVRARGGQVVFDPNYRPAGWASREVARNVIEAFVEHATLILATIDDENLLYGRKPSQEHARRWHHMGIKTVVFKCGPGGAIIYEDEQDMQTVPAKVCDQPIDTTGAGDSFNAAFMAMKCFGYSNLVAAQAGNLLASYVIQHPGAIMPRIHMPDLLAEYSSSDKK